MKKEFNVIEYNWNGKVQPYDVLPYFRNAWNSKSYNFDKKEVTNKKDLKSWIERVSQYRFWARCEYEFVMLPWPYKQDDPLSEGKKIDVHWQIMNNINILVDILSEEFKIN